MTAYIYRLLGLPAGAYPLDEAIPSGINNADEVVGFYFAAGPYYPDSASHGFMHRNGAVVTFDTPTAALDYNAFEGVQSDPEAVNNLGQVLGTDITGTGDGIANYLYTAGSFAPLTIPQTDYDQNFPYVAGLNDSGVVLGQSYTYVPATGAIAPVSDPLGSSSSFIYDASIATAINDAGQIVGYYDPATASGSGYGFTHGFLDTGGSYVTIDAPGAAAYTDGYGDLLGGTKLTGINGSGQIVGTYSAQTADGFTTRSFLYSQGVFTDIAGPADAVSVSVTGINDNGDVIGWYNTATTSFNAFIAHPFLFSTDADSVDFNALTADQLAVLPVSDIYHARGGSDVVVLPSMANYGAVGWSNSAAQPFYTQSLPGDSPQITGSDGNYFIVTGQGADTVVITGNGNNTIVAGAGADTLDVTGNGDDVITLGTGTDTVELTDDSVDEVQAGSGGTGISIVEFHGTLVGDTAGVTGRIAATTASSGTVTVGSQSSFEVTATFNGTIAFGPQAGGTVILDRVKYFNGNFTGLQIGDSIVLKGSSVATQNAVRTAAIAPLFKPLTLVQGPQAPEELVVTQANDAGKTVDGWGYGLIGDAANPTLAGDYFQVSASGAGGADTTLTLEKGNPVDIAVGGSAARQQAPGAGAGVTIGIISDSFNLTGGEAADIAAGLLPPQSQIKVLSEGAYGGDEGRAMAQIIHAIAPGAALDFTSGLSTEDVMANDIRTLTAAGCQIIVDDISYIGEDTTGPIADAIQAAYAQGVTFVTSAGNDRGRNGTFGHENSALELSTAAMNYLATPSPSGGYLPQSTEPFSSIGSVALTGVDGGSGTQPHFAPFYGTSAAAPTVAAVAALMMSADPQLLHDPVSVDAELKATAAPFGEPASQAGAGLVNGPAAVAAALAATHIWFRSNATHLAFAVDAGVLSIAIGNVAIGAVETFQLTLNGAATVTGTPGLTLTDGGVAHYDALESTPGAGVLAFDYTAAAGQAAANLAVMGMNLDGGAIQDGQGQEADLSDIFGVATGVSVGSPLIADGFGPLAPASIAAGQPAGMSELNAGQTVQLAVTFGEIVTVTGPGPVLTLNDGATAAFDPAASTASTLVFDYAVGAGDRTPDLAVAAVALPGATTVQDGAGYNADFSAILNQSSGIQIGQTFVTGFFSSQTGAVDTGAAIQLTIGISGGLLVDTTLGAPALTLNDGSVAAYDAAASSPASGMLVFDDVVAAGDATPDLSASALNAGLAVIRNLQGGAVDFSGALDSGTGLTVNGPLLATAVTATPGEILTGATLAITLAFNEAVSIDTAEGAAPVLSLSDGAAASYDALDSDPGAGTLLFDYAVAAGDQTASLGVTGAALGNASIQDAAGNNADFAVIEGAPLGVGVNTAAAASAVTAVNEAPGSGALSTGGLALITLSLSEPVTVAGSPVLHLDNAATAAFDLADSTATSLVFRYQVAASDRAVPSLAAASVGLPSGAMVLDMNLAPVDLSLAGLPQSGPVIDTAPACYCHGTLVLTDRGERPVEVLAIGEVMVTASGQHRRIKWIGRRGYVARFLAAHPNVQPVRFHAGSLGGGLPRRALLVSPEHAMVLDGVLVPARCLLNGSTITQERGLAQVDYVHVELDSHDVILAEGAASETFLDDGSRDVFHNAVEFGMLYPDAPIPGRFCAPRVESGYALEAIRRKLAPRDGPLPTPLRTAGSARKAT